MNDTTRLAPSRIFPPAETASPQGLIGVGGKLSTAWLLDAYRHGIFPWPFDDGQLAWWSPDPRAIFELNDFHVSRSLRRACRSGRFQTTCDRAFAAVMQGCATAQGRGDHTWITPEMHRAYGALHEQGHAHSVEVWHEGQLAGGVYGLAIAGMFAAESMFYHVTDASKIALVALIGHLRMRGYLLLDIQQLTPHTASLGAREISRREYLARLSLALRAEASFGDRLEVLAGWSG